MPAWLLGTSQHYDKMQTGVIPGCQHRGRKSSNRHRASQGFSHQNPNPLQRGMKGGGSQMRGIWCPKDAACKFLAPGKGSCPQPDEVWLIQRFPLLSELTALQSIPFPLKQIRVDSSMLWHRFIQGSEGEVRSVVQGGPGMAEGQKRNLGRRRNRRGSKDGPECWDHRSWEGTELRRPRPVSDGAQNSSNVKNWERGRWIQQQGSLSCPWPQALQCGWKSGWRMRIKGEETLTVVLKGR